MKLQVAFDVLPLEEALDLARGMEEDVDRFELGTPFLLEHGMEAVRRFRAQFPGKELLADTKIMDAGRLEAESAFRAGADLVTVLAVTDLATVRACVEAADRAGRRVVADMICVSDLSGRARELGSPSIPGWTSRPRAAPLCRTWRCCAGRSSGRSCRQQEGSPWRAFPTAVLWGPM